MPISPRHSTRPANGHSLLELVVATVLLSATLVPALGLMRDGMKISREIETASVINSLCVSKLEENLVNSAANWANGTDSGTFSASGYASLRYSVVASDAVIDGGLPDQLMVVTSTVWEDDNANSSWDSGELRVVYATMVAKMATYRTEAGI